MADISATGKPKTFSLPIQRLGTHNKTEDWKRDCVDSIITISRFGEGIPSSWDDLASKCYGYYNGEILREDYSHILEPYGKRRRNLPGKLQNYNIIKPAVDLLLGEFQKRPLNYTVKALNSDAQDVREQVRAQKLKEVLIRQFYNELVKAGLGDPETIQEDMPLEQFDAIFSDSYRDSRALTGQASLDYILEDQEVKRKLAEKAFKHWLISGKVISLRTVDANDVKYDILDPMNVDYEKSEDTDFIEDASWAVTRSFWYLSDVVDRFYDALTDKDLKKLEKTDSVDPDSFVGIVVDTSTDISKVADDYRNANTNRNIQPQNDYNKWTGRIIPVYRVYWKSLKRIGILSYVDNMGQPGERIVEDGTVISDDESIEWFWVTEVWEGYRIGKDIYVNIRPIPVQRRKMDNYSECKLPINGRLYSDLNATNISFVMLGIPFQLQYNVYKYRLDVAVGRARDAIAQIDISLIPKEWDMDKFLYWAEATGIMWTQYSKDNGEIAISPQHQTVLDLSFRHIDAYINLIESIKSQWEDLSGVSRQRKGQMSPYEGKATTEHSIVQSSHITEDLFGKFGAFVQRDLAALLDYSKYAWVDGKKGSYITKGHQVAYLAIDGIQHMESEYGVFVTSSVIENRRIETLRMIGQQLATQTGAPLSVIAKIVEGNSFLEIEKAIKEAEDTQRQLEEAQRAHEQQMAEAAQQAQAQAQQFEAEQRDRDRQKDIEIAQIEAQTRLAIAKGEQGKGIYEAFDRTEETQIETEFKEKELKEKVRLEEKSLDLEKEKMQQDAEIAEKELAIKKIAANKPVTRSK